MTVFKQGNKWRARYQYKGQKINVGSYSTAKEAQAALDKARAQHTEIPTPPLEDFGDAPKVRRTSEVSLFDKIKGFFGF